MKQSDLKNMKFDEKLDFFSTHRVSAVPVYRKPFELSYQARIGGLNVTLGYDSKTREEALHEAREYKSICVNHERGSAKAVECDIELEARLKAKP